MAAETRLTRVSFCGYLDSLTEVGRATLPEGRTIQWLGPQTGYKRESEVSSSNQPSPPDCTVAGCFPFLHPLLCPDGPHSPTMILPTEVTLPPVLLQ